MQRADLTVIAVLLLSAGCADENQQASQLPDGNTGTEEAILELDHSSLPRLPLVEFAELLRSAGSTTSIEMPPGVDYRVRVYVNNGTTTNEVLQEKGRDAPRSLEIGLYCIRDYQAWDDKITINSKRERIVLDIPSTTASVYVPGWKNRPFVFHTREPEVSGDEQPFIAMYHPGVGDDSDFENAMRLAREGDTEAVFATIQLLKWEGEQDADDQSAAAVE
jgi:hypothetical protein